MGALFMGQPSRPGQPPERSLAKRADGLCVFREDRRCAVHAEGGEAALPVGCRHYPRVVRLDRDRISLSLSHYCPTAASLLTSDEPVRVVRAEPPLALSEPVEGLDARDALPPVLRPEMLMDLDAYEQWERAAIAEFSTCRPVDVALRRVAGATDLLREWRPGAISLDTAVTRAFAQTGETDRPWLAEALPLARALNRGIVSVDLVPDSGPRTGNGQAPTDVVERVIANYLAARVFGNWIAYQGRGLRTIVTWIAACHEVVRLLMARGPLRGVVGAIEAIRQADYVMLHTIDTQHFANAARDVER
jgi:hypothetical protein